MELKKLAVGRRVKSFWYAVQGIATILNSQPNTWYMALATVAVIMVGFWLNLAAWEWCWIMVAACLVWMGELINSAIEFLTDLASPQPHPLAKNAKDAAAAAVLVAVVFSLLVAALILLPKLLARLL